MVLTRSPPVSVPRSVVPVPLYRYVTLRYVTLRYVTGMELS